MVDYNELYELTCKLTLLYVEDDEDFKEETCDVLESLFKKVDHAKDGQEALEKYSQYHQTNGVYYDIVISDIDMPKLNGVELTKEIYKINEQQPIIIISAHNEPDHLLEFVNMGIEQFMVKPLDLDKTISLLYKVSKKVLENKIDDPDDPIIILNNDYKWDTEESLLYNGDNQISLTYKETLLMGLFIKNGVKVSTHEEIFATLWDDPYLANNHSLKCIVSRLRKKLPYQEVKNVSKIGYKLIF